MGELDLAGVEPTSHVVALENVLRADEPRPSLPRERVIEPAPEVNPSLKYLAALYRSIRANQVQAIFTEPPTAPRLAKQVGCDLRLLHFSSGRWDRSWRHDENVFRAKFHGRLETPDCSSHRIAGVDVATKEELLEVMSPHWWDR